MARLLAPLSRLYAASVNRRLSSRAPYRSRLPVVCVGNFTAGGTGKTPLTQLIARLLIGKGERPAILTRGYGGRVRGTHFIDTARDRTADVGDEPLLLAHTAPTLVARDRRAGAIAIERDARDFSVIVMDDGMQNPLLAKDLTIAVVDALRGLGNGLVIPSGPLRAPLEVQLPLTDAIILNRPPVGANDDEATAADAAMARRAEQLRRDFQGPVLEARAVAAGDTSWLADSPLFAFAGIANPARFHALIEQLGGRIADRRNFRDHHAFTATDAERLLARAADLNARLITTQKDHVRLLGHEDARAILVREARVLEISLALDAADAGRLDALLAAAMSHGGYRAGLSRG